MKKEISKKQIEELRTRLFSHGLTGGCCITSITLDNGIEVSKDVYYFYDNFDITVRIFCARCPSGVWYDPVRIQLENTRTHKIIEFNSERKYNV